MSAVETLAELPPLSAEERAEVLRHLWSLEEQAGPTETKKALLDRAQASYDSDPSEGTPWREVEAKLRGRS
jgi:putative addiction module component (TIGR02574 family)